MRNKANKSIQSDSSGVNRASSRNLQTGEGSRWCWWGTPVSVGEGTTNHEWPALATVYCIAPIPRESPVINFIISLRPDCDSTGEPKSPYGPAESTSRSPTSIYDLKILSCQTAFHLEINHPKARPRPLPVIRPSRPRPTQPEVSRRYFQKERFPSIVSRAAATKKTNC
jgi:hypothetical protein